MNPSLNCMRAPNDGLEIPTWALIPSPDQGMASVTKISIYISLRYSDYEVTLLASIASSSHLRMTLPESCSRPLLAKWPNLVKTQYISLTSFSRLTQTCATLKGREREEEPKKHEQPSLLLKADDARHVQERARCVSHAPNRHATATARPPPRHLCTHAPRGMPRRDDKRKCEVRRIE